MDTQVLIAGAGPTGLTLAVDLGMRGVRCTLIEQKHAPQFLPKMERCNARTLEIYRRMGIAEKVRDAGLPRDCADGRVHRALARRAAAAAQAAIRRCTGARPRSRATHDGTLPLEPYQLISQYTLEPLLKSVAETLPSVSVRYGHELVVVHAGCQRRHGDGEGSRTARPRRSRRTISSAATAAAAWCARRSASGSPATRTACCSCGSRCMFATACSTASPWARAATITSPTTTRRSSSCRTRPGTSRCIRSSTATPT